MLLHWVHLLVGQGGSTGVELQQRWLMIQKGLHVHGKIRSFAANRRQIAANGVLKSACCGAEGDSLGLSWNRLVAELGLTTGGMEAVEVLHCQLFVGVSAVDFRFHRFWSSQWRLQLLNCRCLFEQTCLVICVGPRVPSSGRRLFEEFLLSFVLL